MIRIFEGVPGSGKSYAMVYYLRRWADWDEFYKEWVLNEGVVVISNIDSLRIPHLNLDRLISELGGVREVFSEGFVKALWDKGYKKIIFAVDEAQKYFDRRFYDKDVFFFFQYHRHYGVDILLATQDASVLPKEIRVLAEFIIRAEQRSLTLNSFKYKYYSPDGNTHLFNQTLRKDKRVFSIYKSFHAEEADKPPNVLIRQLVLPVAGFFLFIGFAYVYVTTFMFPKPSKPPSHKAEPVRSRKPSKPKPVPSSPPVSPSPYSIPISGYAFYNGAYYYFTDLGILKGSPGSCSVSGNYLFCTRPLAVHIPRISPPSSSPSQGQNAHPQGGGGLVNIQNKSHTPTPSSVSLSSGGANP